MVSIPSVDIVVVLLALLLLKKKKQRDEDVKIDPTLKKSPESRGSSGLRNSRARSEFSITSVESGGVSSSMVVLSSPVVNGLRFEDLLKAPAELLGRGKHGSLYKVKPDGGDAVVGKRIKDWKISRDELKYFSFKKINNYFIKEILGKKINLSKRVF